jgi:hypothetical protein
MHRRTRRAVLAALGAGGLAVAVALAGPTTHARGDLAPPSESPPLPDASGRLTVQRFPSKGERPERTWIRVQAHKLAKKAPYTIWVDDPRTPEADFAMWGDGFTTRGNGNVNLRVDSKHGGAMPFDLGAFELDGAAVEIRDGEGVVVLSGNLPRLPDDPDNTAT